MPSTTTAPVVPSQGRLHPLGLAEVHITGGFWGRRQDVNHVGTIAHIGRRLESEGWLPNFDLAVSGGLPDGRRGREFSDSEVYKYLEALAWEIGRTDDTGLEEDFRSVVARVAAAQEPDGYVNTRFGRPGQDARWSDLEWGHELYCLGHLFQAAVARARTRPDADDGLTGIARRAADLVCREFGSDGRDAVCGHAEVEVGLAELGRALEEPRYLEQARIFVERHGAGTLHDIEWGRSYFQDDMPLRDAEALRGHAVRANYLSSAAVDVAVDTGDDDLLGALRRQWEHTVARRTYITGGQGSHHQDEAFGGDWELPSDRAYSETCAGIGSIMFSWRLLLESGDPRYADLVERTLYNVVATSPSDDGRAFYYANTLHQRVPGAEVDPASTSPRAGSALRAPWFDVSCCPPNVARTLASLDAYLATTDASGLQVHQYAPATIRATLEDGRTIAVRVETDYPQQGLVRVVMESESDEPWTLSLRVPAWAHGAVLRVDGDEPVAVRPGVASVERAFRAGDVVELALPLAARAVTPDPRIDAVRGSIAVERGPEVFALESTDLAGTGIPDVADAVAAGAPVDRDGVVWLPVRRRAERADGWPYGPQAPPAALDEPVEVALIPYHRWARRGPSTMRVWIPST